MGSGIIVCRLSLIKTYLLAFHILRKFRDSGPLMDWYSVQCTCSIGSISSHLLTVWNLTGYEVLKM